VPDQDVPGRDEHLRARSAVLGVLESLRDAHRAHDDRPVPLADLLATVRRWIGSQTFSPRTGSNGMMLMDAPGAAYADLDDLRLVGLVDADWPERSRRSISIQRNCSLSLDGQPRRDRLAAARARFTICFGFRASACPPRHSLEDDACAGVGVFEEIDTPACRYGICPRPMARVCFTRLEETDGCFSPGWDVAGMADAQSVAFTGNRPGVPRGGRPA
jgi:hypothetical protein